MKPYKHTLNNLYHQIHLQDNSDKKTYNLDDTKRNTQEDDEENKHNNLKNNRKHTHNTQTYTKRINNTQDETNTKKHRNTTHNCSIDISLTIRYLTHRSLHRPTQKCIARVCEHHQSLGNNQHVELWACRASARTQTCHLYQTDRPSLRVSARMASTCS